MKLTTLAGALPLLLLPAACRAPMTNSPATPASSATVAGPSTLANGRYTLVVHGMSCPKCVSNVELQLARIDGITHPEVDMKHGFVRIDVERGNPTKQAVADAIADSGFTLLEIREERP